MGLEAQKSSIDIGIIVKDIDAMMKFYGEILGLDLEATIPMPGGGTMNRFKVGDRILRHQLKRSPAVFVLLVDIVIGQFMCQALKKLLARLRPVVAKLSFRFEKFARVFR